MAKRGGVMSKRNKKQARETKPFIRLRIERKDGEKIDGIATRKIKRFYHFIKAEKFTDCIFNLCVNYGNGYKNEGKYHSKKCLIQAVKSFMEVFQ